MMSQVSQNSSVPRCPVLVGQQNPQNTAVFRITVPRLSHGCGTAVPRLSQRLPVSQGFLCPTPSPLSKEREGGTGTLAGQLGCGSTG